MPGNVYCHRQFSFCRPSSVLAVLLSPVRSAILPRAQDNQKELRWTLAPSRLAQNLAQNIMQRRTVLPSPILPRRSVNWTMPRKP
ncbi:protein of unknown function [Paraburkholderia dioscoreae]|uniref:Uncharacterized protein n=1 Tax=Paraburkholderia dioscoreae TaxID=2604047 RepID=A0A5Q4ZNK2_9BURK|nr:protein of unknown function [Paraburkholderia dioscoreae]